MSPLMELLRFEDIIYQYFSLVSKKILLDEC